MFPDMTKPENDIAPPASESARLADDSKTVDRLAKAADISVTSVRNMLRSGLAPQNRHVRQHYLRALAKELAKFDVKAEMSVA